LQREAAKSIVEIAGGVKDHRVYSEGRVLVAGSIQEERRSATCGI
jgi:hypothetical protein